MVYWFGAQPEIASIVLVISALGATILDGTGNVLFYRAVHAYERAEMTAVFLTYRDLSQLVTPGLYAILLAYFALPIVFISSTVWMLVGGYFSKFVPGRMR